MPRCGESPLNKMLAASRPPAEAPTPTTGKRGSTSERATTGVDAALPLGGSFLAGILLLRLAAIMRIGRLAPGPLRFRREYSFSGQHHNRALSWVSIGAEEHRPPGDQ